MTDVQKALLELLKEIDYICRKNNIEYYLGGGCLIGAIRHGQFLPWDDDADIHMTRENAERFVEAVKREKTPNRIVYTGIEDGKNTLPHWRYENTKATTFMRGYVGSSDPKGHFVDIFVNYPLPWDEKQREKSVDAFRLYCELKANNRICRAWMPESFWRKYINLLKLEKIVGRKTLQRYYEKRAFEHPEMEAPYWLDRSPILRKEKTPRALWGTPRYIPFEDTMMPVAEYAEKLLNYSYGPLWFEVPAYAEQGLHVFVEDLDIPYSVYDADQRRHFDVEKFYAEERKKKEFRANLLRDRNIVMPNIRMLQGICTTLELQNAIEERGIDLRKMVEQGKGKALAELFAPFWDKVSSSSFRYYNVYLDMPDEYLYAIVYFQCFNDSYGIARKVLGMRRTQVERELTPDLQRLCDLCDATDELLTALYGDLDMEKARQLVDEWLAKESEALYFMRADVYLRLSGYGTGPDAELLCRCDRYLEQYADDGELLKYRGDLLFRLGKLEEGERCYRKALCSLRNGFCIRAVKEYFAAKSLEAVG